MGSEKAVRIGTEVAVEMDTHIHLHEVECLHLELHQDDRDRQK